MSLVSLSLYTSTVATRRRSEGGKLLRGEKTYDEIHVRPAEMDTWMCFQGARAVMAKLGTERFRTLVPYGDRSPYTKPIDLIDADWLALCGRTEEQVYQCCQASGQFVLVPRKRTAYSAPFDQWRDAAYGKPRRWAKAAKVTDRTCALWKDLTIDFEGFTSSADPRWWPTYPDHVYQRRAPSLWKCSRCGKEHDNPHWAEDWMNRPYIDFCPHCRGTRTMRFMSIPDLVEPDVYFTERHPDGFVFWMGGEQIARRVQPPAADVVHVDEPLPF